MTAAMKTAVGWWVALIGALSTLAIWLSTNLTTVSDLREVETRCNDRIVSMDKKNAVEFAKATDVADKLGRLETTAQNQEALLKEIRDTLRGYDWGPGK